MRIQDAVTYKRVRLLATVIVMLRDKYLAYQKTESIRAGTQECIDQLMGRLYKLGYPSLEMVEATLLASKDLFDSV